MNKLRNMLVGVIAITSMLAVSANSFEGFSVGAIMSQNDMETKGTETKNQRAGKTTSMETSAVITHQKDIDIGSLFAEYTFAQGSTIGLEIIPGEASLGSKTRTHTLNGTGQNVAGTITAKAEVSDHTLIYAEPTKMFNDTFGVYLKGGISKVTVNSLDSQTSTTIAGTYGNKDVYGTAMGIGAKVYRGNMFVKLEHLETDYGNMTFVSSTNKVIEADIDQKATRIALGYNF